jgi:hypothetical protein
MWSRIDPKLGVSERRELNPLRRLGDIANILQFLPPCGTEHEQQHCGKKYDTARFTTSASRRTPGNRKPRRAGMTSVLARYDVATAATGQTEPRSLVTVMAGRASLLKSPDMIRSFIEHWTVICAPLKAGRYGPTRHG